MPDGYEKGKKNNSYSKYNKSLTISSNKAAITKGHDCN